MWEITAIRRRHSYYAQFVEKKLHEKIWTHWIDDNLHWGDALWIGLDSFIHTTISTYNKLYKITIIVLQTLQCCVGGHPNRKLCCDP